MFRFGEAMTLIFQLGHIAGAVQRTMPMSNYPWCLGAWQGPGLPTSHELWNPEGPRSQNPCLLAQKGICWCRLGIYLHSAPCTELRGGVGCVCSLLLHTLRIRRFRHIGRICIQVLQEVLL